MAGHRRRPGAVRRGGWPGWPLPAAASVVLVVAGALTACGRRTEQASGTGNGAAAAAQRGRDFGVRPRAVDLVAYRSPADFPLPFRAWIPAHAEVSSEGEDGGASLRISMAEADSGTAPYLNLFVFPPTTTEEEAEAEAESEMTDRGVPVSRGETPTTRAAPDPRFDWALSQILFAYRTEDGHDHTATVLTGRHEGRLFNITLDGPLPRARWWPDLRAVLDSWRWSDGTPLAATGGGQPESEPDSGADSPDTL